MRPSNYIVAGVVIGALVQRAARGPETSKIRQSIRRRAVSRKRLSEGIVEYHDWLDSLPTTPRGGE